MRLATPILLALLAGAAASCSNDDGGNSETGAACTPGQQVFCACPGGAGGVQVCREDGSGFGACMGCAGDSSGVTSSGDDSGGDLTTSATQPENSGTTADDTGVASVPGGSEGPTSEVGSEGSAGSEGSETGEPTYTWVWVDHGGPAFQPPPCAAMAGVIDGLLVDPQAFFNALVAGKDPNDWVAVLNAIEPDIWACKLGQQRDSNANVRGRLYLPTADCPDASPPPDDAMAVYLGVRQEEACWAHFVDVVGEL